MPDAFPATTSNLPTIGRIVQYRLTAEDAIAITRRRTDSVRIRERIEGGHWPAGAQAHVGCPVVVVGMVFPAMVVAVWAGTYPSINLQVFLDGNDVLWKTTLTEGNDPGQWCWPERFLSTTAN